MINYHEKINSSLNAILPTYYEMLLTSGLKTPCLSYLELNNFDTSTGDTIGYSEIYYQVKVWSTKIAEIQKYALEVDAAMRALGFKRISSAELADNNSAMIQKILTYRALALEEY